MKLLIFVALLTSVAVQAKLKIQKLDFVKLNDNAAKVVINFDGSLMDPPELEVKRGNILQVTMPESIVWPAINKKASIDNEFDTGLKAYQFNKDTVRVRAILPYAVKENTKKISLKVLDNSIEMFFPIQKQMKNVAEPMVKAISKKDEKQVSKNTDKEKYDETYLNYLLEQKDDDAVTAKANTELELKEDKVSTKSSATEKNAISFDAEDKSIEKKQFSIAKYIGKYIAFLGVVLVFLYGLVLMLRKGVLKKGKLGFLNDSSMVTVLSTNYIAPKRSIMMVRVHDKVLLLGNSENGISYLTELDDVAGILKEGEQKVAGDNFDTNVKNAQTKNLDEFIKIKENPFEGADSIANTTKQKTSKRAKKQKSSYSSQLKNKIKELKPLQ